MMAAYAALTSLMHIIDGIEHHPFPPISLDKQQVESLTENVTSLIEFLETYHSPLADGDDYEADPLEMRIADAAYAAEDAIESHIVDMIELDTTTHHQEIDTSTSSGSKNQRKPMMCLTCFGCLVKDTNMIDLNESPYDILYQCLQKVIRDMDLIKKEAMGMVRDKVAAEAQRNVVVSASAASSRSSIMVGVDDALLEIMDKLTAGRLDRQVIPIVGMGGIGKTTLARHVYARPLIKEHFDICAWATISQQYNTKEILCELLSQANKTSKEELSSKSENEVGLQLYQYLSSRRFLIIMDDMWSIEAWEKIQCFFPNNNNSSRIVVTTRLSNLGSQLDNYYGLRMKFLDEVTSWNLFSKTVFGDKSFPPELEEIGRKIVETCSGLPLSIVVMGGLLQKLQHTQECWESIRKSSSSIVNSENEDFCLKILKMSYNHLPVHLKPCFLYMGVFEEDRAVRVSALIKLWVAEGFLRPESGKSLETTAKEYLNDLVDRNLILVHELGSIGNIKYCKVHDLLRDLCQREAGKVGFYNVIGQHKFQVLNRQRCIAIPGSTSKKKAADALRSMQLARSFVCHSKEVLPLPGCRLLRIFKVYDRDRYGSHGYVLDHLFRFVNLRYLAVGARGFRLPYSLNLLWNLQTLIIFHSIEVVAPDQIWKMAQLRHVEFHKGDLKLPDPPSGNIVIMENLQTLKGVRHLKCDEVSKIIPNMKKLGVTDGELPDLECLTKLESCRCWGTYGVGVSSFPCSLKKLSLGSNTYHWEVKEELLEIIGALPLLQKLQLGRAQFSEKQWKTSEGQFPSLKFLELNWCRLECWTTESSHFPRLEKLHLYALKELEEIPYEIGEISTLQSIQLEYCSESVVESAKMIAEEQEELQVRVVLFNNNNHQALRSLASPNFWVEIQDF